VQHHFAALVGKRFLLSDIAQDLQVLTDMHASSLARMLCVAVACFGLEPNLWKFFVCFIQSG